VWLDPIEDRRVSDLDALIIRFANSTAAVTSEFVQMLGISEKEYQQFEELQMAVFSTLIHCRE
jgi:hypothetical protein